MSRTAMRARAWALALAAAAGPALAGAAPDTEAFDRAAALLRAGRWSAAYGSFARLADQGDPDAARMALTLLRFGPRVFETAWTAAPSQLRAWSRLAAQGAPLQVTNDGE